MAPYADPRHLVAIEVATEVVPSREDVKPNNLKKVLYGLDGSPQVSPNKLMRPAIDRGQDLPTYQRSGVAG